MQRRVILGAFFKSFVFELKRVFPDQPFVFFEKDTDRDKKHSGGQDHTNYKKKTKTDGKCPGSD